MADPVKELLLRSAGEMGAAMLEIRIFSHKDYRVGDQKFPTHEEARLYLQHLRQAPCQCPICTGPMPDAKAFRALGHEGRQHFLATLEADQALANKETDALRGDVWKQLEELKELLQAPTTLLV